MIAFLPFWVFIFNQKIKETDIEFQILSGFILFFIFPYKT